MYKGALNTRNIRIGILELTTLLVLEILNEFSNFFSLYWSIDIGICSR